nr:T9SS type A sorting domain-containing protein [Bacteroidota bacterium]
MYTIFHDLSHITGEYILESKLVYPTSYPGQYAYAFNFFGDPALNVMAQGFQVTHDIELPEITTISNEITVKNGATLTIPVNGQLHFEAEGELIIDESATLIISDNANLEALNSNELVVEGNITIGNNVTFTSSGPLWNVYLNNTSLQTVFNNTTFEKCSLHNYGQNLTITNSIFNDCNMLVSHRGNVTITGSTDFYRTWLYLENTEDNNNKATITNCSFSSTNVYVAIDLWNYNEYDISNNTIDGYYNGIQLMQSGYGQTRNQTIQDNNIANCTQKGILAYGTLGDVYRNHITNNRYGVWFADRSNIRLYGYFNAGGFVQTQEIRDNESYEVYASYNSFPIYFRYNVIIDEDNLGSQEDPLIYYSVSGEEPVLDVRYNCWGENFDPATDLYPDCYVWEPTWCPGEEDNGTPDPDEDMYRVANNLFDAQDYTGAKSLYEMLIEQYPQSKFTKAAMQDLFALERFITNDYSGLKQFYANNSIINSDSILSGLGNYMISKCDVKLENWSDAISYYENIILCPETFEDSIFAIIDLGYVYFVMEHSGYKSAYTGKLTEHQPASKEQFIENRNYLLSLIPDGQRSEAINGDITELMEGELIQNIPNPFSGSTEIWYKLENESNIQLNIYNYKGQLIKSINEGTKTKGTHYIIFDANGLKNGIYFYSININGKKSDSKKMTIMK